MRQAGFRTSERKDLELSALQNLRVDFKLEAGEISEAVTVTARGARSAMHNTLAGRGWLRAAVGRTGLRNFMEGIRGRKVPGMKDMPASK